MPGKHRGSTNRAGSIFEIKGARNEPHLNGARLQIVRGGPLKPGDRVAATGFIPGSQILVSTTDRSRAATVTVKAGTVNIDDIFIVERMVS